MNTTDSSAPADGDHAARKFVEDVYNSLAKGECSLWVTRNAQANDVQLARHIVWSVVLNDLPRDKRDNLARQELKPVWQIVERKAAYPEEQVQQDIQLVLDIYSEEDPQTNDDFRKEQDASDLFGILQGAKGLLLALGTPPIRSLQRLHALAPKLRILVLADDGETTLLQSGIAEVVSAPPHFFWTGLRQRIDAGEKPNRLNLKNAFDLEFDVGWIANLGPGLKILTAEDVKEERAVSQKDFDSFLSGDLNWNTLSSGVAADRGAFASIRSDEDTTQEVDPVKHICAIAKKLDATETNPNTAMESVIVFSEKGTGKSTMLRQAAISLSRKGYPTLITNPRPTEIKAETLLRFIIYIQDLWARNREGKGQGYGNIPVCILLDSDAEIAAREAKIANLLSRELNRKVLLVRVLERSREEIESATNVVQMLANTSRDEVLHIGQHLGEYCATRDLQEIPGRREWEAYYTGFFTRYQSHINQNKDLPHLFLVAIYPFVKERVRDERSLARYLFENWRSIEEANARRLVEIAATAGFYGISLPYECLCKMNSYESVLRGNISKEDERVFDTFATWERYRHFDASSWSIYARHPAICGMLLSMTAPREATAPYTRLVELLESLTGSFADTWLCEAVAAGVGSWFKSGEKAFGIEFETPRQRAARELLEAIPETIVLGSRLICHQYARFHIHVLHACLEKLENPETTILTGDELLLISKDRLQKAKVFVDDALSVYKSNEKISNVLNSLAAATSRFANALRTLDENEARELDIEAIDLGIQAVEQDIANGHALQSVVTTLQKSILSNMNEPEDDLRYFEEAEDRLQTLCTLHTNKQWRNSDEVEAELSIFRLLQIQEDAARSLNLRYEKDQGFVMRNRISFLIVRMRLILAGKTIRDGFQDPETTVELRALRSNIESFDGRNLRELGILYRLYSEDFETRFNFETRLRIIEDIRREDPESAEVFLHDQAALLCQVGEFDPAKEVFKQIYELRQSDPDKWFWMNEKILIDNSKDPACAKEVVVTVIDDIGGWASYSGVRVKIQPRQFGNISRNQPIPCYLRFRLSGLQAIDERMAEQDLLVLGAKTNA